MKILLIILLIFIFSCKNENSNLEIKNKKEVTTEKLVLKIFPVDTTCIGFIDFEKIIDKKWFTKLIKDGALISDANITFDETTLLSFFFNIDDFLLKKDFRGSILLKNVNLSLKNIRKKKKYNGFKINVLDEDIAFSVVNNDFLIGTTLELEKEIDILSDRFRNLASTPRNKKFRNILSKLSKNTFFKIAFIPNNKIENLLRKISLKKVHLSNFLNSLNAISLGISLDKTKNNVIIKVIIDSSKQGIIEINSVIYSFMKRTENNVTNKEISYFLSKTKLEIKGSLLYITTNVSSEKFVDYILYWYEL